MIAEIIHKVPHRVEFFEIVGRLDHNHTSALAGAVDTALHDGRNYLILDLSGVEYMNSAGLRVLVQVYKEVQRTSGALVVANPSPQVMRLMNLVGLDSVLTIHQDPTWTATQLSSSALPTAQRHTYYYL